jgi:hypothetical protein
MSSRHFIVIACCILSSCVAMPALMDTPALRGQAEAVLDDLHLAASEADEARYFGHFTPNAVFLGTDATERWTVEAFRAYAHPHFEAGKGWTYRMTERHVRVSEDGKVAWFDERLHNEKYGEVRGSGVLRRDERWRVAQYNLSFPIPNAIAKDVVGMISNQSNATASKETPIIEVAFEVTHVPSLNPDAERPDRQVSFLWGKEGQKKSRVVLDTLGAVCTNIPPGESDPPLIMSCWHAGQGVAFYLHHRDGHLVVESDFGSEEEPDSPEKPRVLVRIPVDAGMQIKPITD